MKTLKWILSVAALVAAGSGVARAGFKLTENVVVNTSSRVAYGSIGSARNSADTTQSIGCETWAFADGTSNGGCFATTAGTAGAAPVSASCYTGNVPAMLAVIGAMNGANNIIFEWDANGNCTYLGMDNSSYWEPKK